MPADHLPGVLNRAGGEVRHLLRLGVLGAPHARLQQAHGAATTEQGHAGVLPRSAQVLHAVEGDEQRRVTVQGNQRRVTVHGTIAQGDRARHHARSCRRRPPR